MNYKQLKFSEAQKITIDKETGTVSIYMSLGDDPIKYGVFKMSLPQLLSLNAKACAVVSSNEYLPEDFIQDIQKVIEVVDENSS